VSIIGTLIAGMPICQLYVNLSAFFGTPFANGTFAVCQSKTVPTEQKLFVLLAKQKNQKNLFVSQAKFKIFLNTKSQKMIFCFIVKSPVKIFVVCIFC